MLPSVPISGDGWSTVLSLKDRKCFSLQGFCKIYYFKIFKDFFVNVNVLRFSVLILTPLTVKYYQIPCMIFKNKELRHESVKSTISFTIFFYKKPQKFRFLVRGRSNFGSSQNETVCNKSGVNRRDKNWSKKGMRFMDSLGNSKSKTIKILFILKISRGKKMYEDEMI